MYCLIYLEDVIAFSKNKEEHLWCLHVVFECFQEHNLKLKPSKCTFFCNQISYLANHVSKEVQQGESQSCGWICPTSVLHWNPSLLGPGRSLHVIHQGICMAQSLHEHLSGEGTGKKNKGVTLNSDMQTAFKMLKKACLEAPVLAFADFDQPFLMETNASKLGLGAVLSQKQPDMWYHLVAYVSQSLTTHGCNYHSTKQEFLALKWVIAEQFQEYLHWKPFVVKTDNNTLTYILTTPNLMSPSILGWSHW